MKNKRFLPRLLFFLVMFAVMRFQGASLVTPVSPYGIIDIEFARLVPVFNKILAQVDRTDVVFNILLDFVFIAAYWIFLAITFDKLWLESPATRFQMRKTHYALISIAALLDVVENISMLVCIAGRPTQFLLELTFVTAIVKFFAIACAILYLLILLIQYPFRPRRYEQHPDKLR